MINAIPFGEISIQPVETAREINFTIIQGESYLFRLVPCFQGFELSPLDKCLQIQVDVKIVQEVECFIENYFM